MAEINYLKDFLLIGLIGLFLGWLSKDMIQESIMSRRIKRINWKKDKGEFEDGVSHLLKTLEDTGKVTAGGVDRIKRNLIKAGYKEVGFDPTFGKPWYTGPLPMPNISKLKSQIKGRLGRGWESAVTTLRLKRREKIIKKDDPLAYLAAFKRKKA